MNGLALCSGMGGLELGLRLALGDAYRTVCYVERQAECAVTLLARMEDEALDRAPIWDNLETFDGEKWRGLVDIVTAGLPCQPFSVAGKRRGTDDERHLWPEVWRIIEECRPALVFIENVPGLVSTRTVLHRSEVVTYINALDAAIEGQVDTRKRWYAGYHRERLYGRLLREVGISALLYVCCELEELGFCVATGVFSAAEVGAPHRRERVFVLAYRTGVQREGRPDAVLSTGQGRPRSKECERTLALRLADPGIGFVQKPGRGPGRRTGTRSAGKIVGNAEGDNERRDRLSGTYKKGQSAGGSSLPPFPPGPGDLDAWAEVVRVDPTLEPAICDLPHGSADRMDLSRAAQLCALGNAVVPVVVAYAFLTLAERVEGIGN